MTKTIAFANLKGGTGKTSTCVNTAGSLAKNNQDIRVLVVDFDPQANATLALGVDPSALKYSIYDAVLEQCDGYSGVPLIQTILETQVANLHLAPAELDLISAPLVMQQTRDRVGILSRILESVKPFYDYILIDVASDSGLLIFNSLRAADQVVVPLDPSLFSLQALENLKLYCCDLKEMTGHVIDQLTIVLNRYVQSKTTPKKAAKPSPSEEIKTALETMDYPLFTIPDSVLIFRAQQLGIPVSHYASASPVEKAYQAIANHLKSHEHESVPS